MKTTRVADARAGTHGVERTLHGLATVMLRIPTNVDPGHFTVSDGTIESARRPRRRVPLLSELVEEYLDSQTHKARSSVYTERVHLRDLAKFLGPRSDSPIDRIDHRDLERFLQTRLNERSTSTVHKERDTIVQFFRWAAAQGQLDTSPPSD